MNIETLEAWFLALVKSIVTRPESVVIEKLDDEMGRLLVVKVSDADRGRVIGKKGKIAEALRTILRAAGYLADIRIGMKIYEPESNFDPRRDED